LINFINKYNTKYLEYKNFKIEKNEIIKIIYEYKKFPLLNIIY